MRSLVLIILAAVLAGRPEELSAGPGTPDGLDLPGAGAGGAWADGVVTGRLVRGATGAPLAGLVTIEGPGGFRATAEAGAFRIEELRAGRYTIEFSERRGASPLRHAFGVVAGTEDLVIALPARR
jgi:hypothetical protein